MSKTEKISDKQRRIQNFETQRRHMMELGYTEHIGTIAVIKANIMALLTAGPFAVAAVLIYGFYWDWTLQINWTDAVLCLICIPLSIPVHEGIHGLTWGLFCKNGFKSIRFGVMKESLTPYCHCMEPLSFASYLLGGLMPFLILGVGLFIISLLGQSVMLLGLSFFSMLAAGGDTTIVWMLIPYRDAKIIDHPTDCGFVAFRKKDMK